ncbi:hypothetical protein GCM10010116_04910 [Microbispora rosea subsp. aerata]|nr:hypothetical protein GCM10010116_04910 [Microbispora rosea subsp. aerata]GIH54608.1 hypothetical protein Mro02_15220 [Microbispora rosea subsp. aerata]
MEGGETRTGHAPEIGEKRRTRLRLAGVRRPGIRDSSPERFQPMQHEPERRAERGWLIQWKQR